MVSCTRATVTCPLRTASRARADTFMAACVRWLTPAAEADKFVKAREPVAKAATAKAAADIGYPVVVKGTGVAHKSEDGLVATHLVDADQVHQAATEILAKGSTGLLVAKHDNPVGFAWFAFRTAFRGLDEARDFEVHKLQTLEVRARTSRRHTHQIAG